MKFLIILRNLTEFHFSYFGLPYFHAYNVHILHFLPRVHPLCYTRGHAIQILFTSCQLYDLALVKTKVKILSKQWGHSITATINGEGKLGS